MITALFAAALNVAAMAATGADVAAVNQEHAIKQYAPTTGAVETIDHEGRVCLWVAFGGLLIPCLYMGFATFQLPDGKRYFHTLSFLINAIASTAYLVMATGYGNVYVAGTGPDFVYRQFFFARYIDWSLTTPLMLLDLAGLAGASFDTTMWLLSTDFLMIVAGLIGGLIGSQDIACWGFWCFGMLAFMPIVYFLAFRMQPEHPATAALYSKVSNLTIFFWTAYPVVWILAEGTGTISSNTECILYTILDIICKSVFGLLIVSARDGIEAACESSESGKSGTTPLA